MYLIVFRYQIVESHLKWQKKMFTAFISLFIDDIKMMTGVIGEVGVEGGGGGVIQGQS